MNRSLIFCLCLLALTACARLPRIDPFPAGCRCPSAAASACRDLYPHGRWQLFHAIEATLPGGGKQILTGVSVICSDNLSIRCALMTVEGFVIFSGRWNGVLSVDRAVPPFDRPGFAEGLMTDLRLLFFAPRDPLLSTGLLEQGDPVCRFGSAENTIDIAMKGDGERVVHQYGSNHGLRRSIVADAPTPMARGAFSRHLVLKHHGVLGYQLKLKLIEAIPLDEEPKK
jgi:hypothetical protein